MAEMRCPMCGKLNPEGSEVCQFCQARMKPLAAGDPSLPQHTPTVQSSPDSQPMPEDSAGQEDGTAESSGADAALPDWLNSLRQEDLDLLSNDQSDENLPNWLFEEPGAAEEVENAFQDEGDGLDWLTSLRSTSQEDQEQSELPQHELPQPPDADQPSSAWLPGDEQMFDGLEAPPIIPDAADPMTVEDTQAADQTEPEWLHRIQARQHLEGAETDHISSTAVDPADSQEQTAFPGVEAPAESVPPFAMDRESGGLDEIPDWLANIPERDEPEQASTTPFSSEAPESASDLASAELPNWLEAMRPVEAAAAGHPERDETDRLIESSGPLSGLRGVLPAEPDIARVKKPAVHSTRLQISESQQSHVSIFEELIKTEGQARSIPSRSPVSSQTIVRLAIFLILFLGIAWPVYTGSQTVPLPSLPSEVDDVSIFIDGLSNGAPVLLAVDYQPGFSPEMDAAAGAVVDHLMLKGAYLTLVTTTPTGPAQAERLIRLVNSRGGHPYQGIDQYANLGFIPGGAAGLLSFAETPRRILPYSQEGSFAWTVAPLQAVEHIGDFALVLVMTENPDTARAWIEQAQPELENTPLLMVISAQAEPVVRPYYDGSPRQVGGFVAGLFGGAAYENLQARMGLGRKYWDSFSAAILLAAGLIVIVGAANLVSAGLSNRKQAGKEDPV